MRKIRLALFRIRPMHYSEAVIRELKKYLTVKTYYIYGETGRIGEVPGPHSSSQEKFFIYPKTNKMALPKLSDSLKVLYDVIKFSPQVLFFQGLYKVFLPTIVWGILSGRKICFQASFNSQTKMGFLKRIRKRLFGAVFGRLFDVFFSIGKRCREWLYEAGIPKNKIYEAPYTTDTTTLLEKARNAVIDRDKLRMKNGLEGYVFLSVCRLIEEKCLVDAITALSFFKNKRGLPINYLIIGDGPQREILEKLSYQQSGSNVNIVFLGRLPYEKLATYYAMSDFFLLPSSHERWGVVVHEAALFGLALLLSDQVGAAADLLVEGVNGFSFPPDSPDAIVKAIKKVINKEFLEKARYESHKLALKRNEQKTANLIYQAMVCLFPHYRQRLHTTLLSSHHTA